MPKNNLPAYFEELKIKEENVTLSLSDLLAQFKQQIPVNFVYLEIKERNYQCSTTGWKEPVCERYGFEYQGQWKQIDIPHPLMEKLGLKKGEDLPSAFYLAPHLLKKDQATTQGGITLQAGEIILVNPSKQEIQTDLSSSRIKELEETIAEQTKQIQAKDQELADLRTQFNQHKNQKLLFFQDIHKAMLAITPNAHNLNEADTIEDIRAKSTLLKQWTDAFPNQLSSQVKNELDGLNNLKNDNETFFQNLKKSMTSFDANIGLGSKSEIISIISDINDIHPLLKSWFNNLHSILKTVSETHNNFVGATITSAQFKAWKEVLLQTVPSIGSVNSPNNAKMNKFLNQNMPVFDMTKIYITVLLDLLRKEKGWWDEWIKDYTNISYVSIGDNLSKLGAISANDTHLISYSFNYQKNIQFRQIYNMREDYCKATFKAIYKYYYDKVPV